MTTARKPNTELSLPSLRGGEKFNVPALKFGGMKIVGRAEADESILPIDLMGVMIFETLKIVIPDITEAEIDDIDQPDILALSDTIGEVNQKQTANFTPKSSATK